MSDERNKFDNLLQSLKQQRDELRVKMHLAQADVKDEWNKWEERFTQLMDDYKPTRDAAGQTAGNVWSALQLAGDEVRKGFEQIRKSLK